MRVFAHRMISRIKLLGRDSKGSVAVVIAVAIIPMLFAIGAAIDLSRAYLVRARLHYALDAAGLAVGASTGSEEDELQDIMQAFFNKNYPSSAEGVNIELDLDITDSLVTLSAVQQIETTFMSLAGFETMDVAASVQITRETTGLEVVMVLDNTGSMSGSKLTSMKSAATSLVNILFGSEDYPDKLKVGLVPFSGSVNIGNNNTGYVHDPDTYDWALDPYQPTVFNHSYTYFKDSPYDWGPSNEWGGCVEARTYPGDVEDTFTNDSDNETGLWTPLFWADTDYRYTGWPFYNNNNWRYNSGTYVIDSTWPVDTGPNKECPRALTPLTNDKQLLLDEIDEMWATGYTHINYGAVWGWRVVSPEAPFTEGLPYGEEGWNKAVIILTDGANTTHDQHYTAYGYEWEARLGRDWGTQDILDDRTAEVCENMKATGVLVYTITFEVSSSSTKTLFRNCATDPDNYFDSPSGDELQTVFKAIGAELSNLRISK